MHIDPAKTPMFGDILSEIYHDPFRKKQPQPQTAEEIKAYIVGRLEELINGTA